MSIVTDAASVSGTIAPVTPDQRHLTGLDLAVLWGDPSFVLAFVAYAVVGTLVGRQRGGSAP